MLDAADGECLARVAPGVFDDPVDSRWCAEFVGDPRHHLAVAVDGDLIVGMASGVHYVHPDKGPELWVNEVGVAPSHRGRGIGRGVVEALLRHGRSLGCREAWVLTGDDNPAAVKTYMSAGGSEAPGTRMFTFDLSTTM